ncbi:hypothetical protein ACLOJK_029351 [Asimina triloba]
MSRLAAVASGAPASSSLSASPPSSCGSASAPTLSFEAFSLPALNCWVLLLYTCPTWDGRAERGCIFFSGSGGFSPKDVEKFDGRINFGLRQVQVNDVLIQSGLHKALKSRPTSEVNKQELEQVRQVAPSQQMEMLSGKRCLVGGEFGEAQILNINHTALSDLSARIPPANVTIAFNFKLRNNNKDKGVFYDDLRLTFYHAPNRSSPIANLTVPAFYQGFKKTAHRKQGVEVVEGRAFWENATRAVSEENRTIVGVKTVRHHLRLHADVEVNEQGKKSKRKGVKFHSTAPPPPPGMKLLPAPLLLLLLVVW